MAFSVNKRGKTGAAGLSKVRVSRKRLMIDILKLYVLQ